MRKTGKAYLKGSYTVEAAAVVTMTIFVLASLIVCGCYLHDRAVIQSMVCETASVGSNFATEAERKKAMSEAAKRLKEERLLGSRELSGSAASGSREATAVWRARYPVAGFAMNFLSSDALNIRASWTCRILDPADEIRKIRGAGRLLAGGDK